MGTVCWSLVRGLIAQTHVPERPRMTHRARPVRSIVVIIIIIIIAVANVVQEFFGIRSRGEDPSRPLTALQKHG